MLKLFASMKSTLSFFHNHLQVFDRHQWKQVIFALKNFLFVDDCELFLCIYILSRLEVLYVLHLEVNLD